MDGQETSPGLEESGPQEHHREGADDLQPRDAVSAPRARSLVYSQKHTFSRSTQGSSERKTRVFFIGGEK